MTPDEFREKVASAHNDVFYHYGDMVVRFYFDRVNNVVETEEYGCELYDTYEQMLDDPYFGGKTLREILPELRKEP